VDLPVARRRTLAAADAGEGDEPHNSLDKNKPDAFMKFSNQFTRFARFSTIALLAGACGISWANIHAAEQEPVVAQRLFASPDEAIKALQGATEAKDKGPCVKFSGRRSQDF
jgi:hypothetical protein